MTHPTEGFYWQPFRHVCGCRLEWGAELPHADRLHAIAAQQTLFAFLDAIKNYPCPMHGSATGVPAPPLGEGQRRYLRANDVWYMLCPPNRHLYGDRLADHLAKEER